MDNSNKISIKKKSSARRQKRIELDVSWFLPGKNKPFIYSTTAARDLIIALAGQTEQKTPLEILPLVNFDQEAKALLLTFIKKGVGDISLSI